VDALLGEATVQPHSFAQLILLSKIRLPSQQPRHYFDERAMEQLIKSVKANGILQPLIVRPVGQEQYELVAGERRYRASVSVGLELVPVIIRDLSDEEALHLALFENLQREDLNPVEETEGILQLLSCKLNQDANFVIKLLQQEARLERESSDDIVPRREWELVLEVFESLGRFTPESFRVNRLPLLNLPNDIKIALREGRIEYTKAREIAKIKSEDSRFSLLENAISRNLSLTEIRKLVKEMRTEVNILTSDPSPKDQIKSFTHRLKQSKLWESDPKKWKRVQNWLTKIEELLESNT
jgi:ParB family chromosome partitioning protein